MIQIESFIMMLGIFLFLMFIYLVAGIIEQKQSGEKRLHKTINKFGWFLVFYGISLIGMLIYLIFFNN